MKEYLAMWYDVAAGKLHTHEFTANDLPSAKHKAFQMLCDSCGDRLSGNVAVYERRYMFECAGESNPRPNGDAREFATRDYYTGMKIRRGGKDNG